MVVKALYTFVHATAAVELEIAAAASIGADDAGEGAVATAAVELAMRRTRRWRRREWGAAFVASTRPRFTFVTGAAGGVHLRRPKSKN